jgi:hypothetical protein
MGFSALIPQRSERRGSLDGSNPEQVPGKQGEVPRLHQGPRGGKASAFQGLPWGIDTFHYGFAMKEAFDE